MSKMCNNKMNQKIAFSVINKYDMEVNKVEASVNELLEETQFDGIEGSKLIFEEFEVYDRPTFVEYLKAGWQIEMRAAIDFSAVSGQAGAEGSLHNPGDSNGYEQALRAIGSVLESYSTADAWSFFGFGSETSGETPGDGTIVTPDDSTTRPLHSPLEEVVDAVDDPSTFAVTVDRRADPNGSGVDSLVAQYRAAATNVQPGEQSRLAPVLRAIMNSIKKNEQIYYVAPLLIAGPIEDLSEAKEVMVQLSRYPCQLVAIGVADADFSQLEELNVGVLKDDNNRACVRRMVSFVRLSDALAKGSLADQVLTSLPDSMCAHCERVSFRLRPGGQASMAVSFSELNLN